MPLEPAKIHILPPNGEQGTLLTIHDDGRITFGPDFTTKEEASLEFWQLLQDAFKQLSDGLQGPFDPYHAYSSNITTDREPAPRTKDRKPIKGRRPMKERRRKFLEGS